MARVGINAITVCVGYDDFLRLTLPRTLLHVDKLMVVTTASDVRTQELVDKYDRAECFITDAFYRGGASFNKGWAMEEGFDALGRDGWILILDADIVLPATMPTWNLEPGKMYTPPRRIMSKVDGLIETPVVDMATLPLRQESGNFGYFQLFHAGDPAIAQLPWYETTWVHAGGADSVFEKRWMKTNKLRLPFEVIHLGDPDQNWFGRVRPRLDTGEVDSEAEVRLQRVEALHRKYGWKGRKKTGEPVAERLGEAGVAAEECHNNAPARMQYTGKGFRPIHATIIRRRQGTVTVQPPVTVPKQPPPPSAHLRKLPPKYPPHVSPEQPE